MSVTNQMYNLVSAIHKSIRRGLIHDSRSFARQLMAIERTNALFGELWTIAAEDIGLADPTIVDYVCRLTDQYNDLKKERELDEKSAINDPELLELVDRAVIAEVLSGKKRMLPMATFATLWDIYNNEKFKKGSSEYINLFIKAVKNDNEKEALYNAFVPALVLRKKKQVLDMIIKLSKNNRNEKLVNEWLYRSEKHKKLLMLTGSIILLCRDLDFDHGKYRNLIDGHLNVRVKKVPIPSYAFDKHTSNGKKNNLGLNHFFREPAKIENERKELIDNWKKVGKKAYLDAEKQGLADGDLILDGIKKKQKAEQDAMAPLTV